MEKIVKGLSNFSIYKGGKHGTHILNQYKRGDFLVKKEIINDIIGKNF